MKRLSTLIISLLLTSYSFAEQDIPKLTLSSSGTISKPADELQLKIGVITQNTTAEQALAENSYKMRNVIENLEMAGLTKEDYETSQFSINPTYSRCPKDPPLDWKAMIIGYEVTNSILVHTKHLDMAGPVIDLAHQAGANSITDIRFGIRSVRDYWTEALSAAGANAVRDAEAIAKATGVRLVRVLSISLNHTQVKSSHLDLSSFARAYSGEASPPIEPGDVSIEANVTLVYEIN